MAPLSTRSRRIQRTSRRSDSVNAVLADPPEHSRRVNDDEVAHAPGLPLYVGDFHTVLGGDTGLVDLRPPGVHVLNEEMHHQVVCELLDIEVLKQKARLTVMEERDPIRVRGHHESEVLVELL